ncbi:hypothetical protein GCM10027450_05970 [Pseudidiomarina andamanensis]
MVSYRNVVRLLFDQKSEFKHELSAADRGTTIPDFVSSLTGIFSYRNSKKIGVAPSTISRELRPNSLKLGLYEPDLAYEQAIARRKKKHSEFRNKQK